MSSSAPNIAVIQASPVSVPVPVPPNPYGDTRKHLPRSTNPSPTTSGHLDINLKDRDPYKMNQHLKIKFSDIFGEPEPRTYSFDQVWVLSQRTFTLTKLWCYRILSFVCAIPCAIFWAITFGCLSFFHIWCCAPCLKSCQIQFRYIREILHMIMQTFIAPIVDALGRCFSHIRVTSWSKRYTEEDDDSRNDEKFDEVHLA